MDTRRALAAAHLLGAVHAALGQLRKAVAARAALNARLARPGLSALCITDDHATTLIEECERSLSCAQEPAGLDLETSELDGPLLERAARTGIELPGERLARALNLGPFERHAVALCAALALDPGLERVFAYLADDLNLREPTAELLSRLDGAPMTIRLQRRARLSAAGVLRRCGVLAARPSGERDDGLRLTAQALGFLLGECADDVGRFRDPCEVNVRPEEPVPPHADAALVARLADALQSGCVATIGVWGPRDAGVEGVVLALASRVGRALRRGGAALVQQTPAEASAAVAEQIEIANAMGAVLWVDAEPLTEVGQERTADLIASAIASAPVPAIVSGPHAWRPAGLLDRRYAEIDVPSPTFAARRRLWHAALPELGAAHSADLSARFRLGCDEMRAVASVARTHASLRGDGGPTPLDVEAACATVVRKRADRFAMFVKPRRGPDDLVLPEALHRQVVEIGRFFRAWPRLSEDWGFSRLGPQTGGIKVLFTGEPGTGKTLAAEVVAGDLGVSLLKVDLARVVSKWVGETEKNLDAAFREAEDSQAVLLFDEAEALFGKRSEVQHGTDRYANLEVSFLLQRLEEHAGLVVLASNLKDQLDAAFLRRFHVLIDFPRPAFAERRRLWERAFPVSTPRDAHLGLDALASLDLTGAGIVSAARTAALLAIDDGVGRITMEHAIRGCARQFRREGRLLSASELGCHAGILETV
jgi:hypothetical protein